MLVLLLAIRAWCSCCWCNTNSRYDPKIVRVSYGRRPDRNEMAPTWAPDLCRSMGTYWVRNGQTYPSVWFRNRAKAMLDDGRSQYLQHGNMLYLCLPLIFWESSIPIEFYHLNDHIFIPTLSPALFFHVNLFSLFTLNCWQNLTNNTHILTGDWYTWDSSTQTSWKARAWFIGPPVTR